MSERKIRPNRIQGVVLTNYAVDIASDNSTTVRFLLGSIEEDDGKKYPQIWTEGTIEGPMMSLIRDGDPEIKKAFKALEGLLTKKIEGLIFIDSGTEEGLFTKEVIGSLYDEGPVGGLDLDAVMGDETSIPDPGEE
jgi:hypothetical protein